MDILPASSPSYPQGHIDTQGEVAIRKRAVAAALVLCVLFGATGVALDSKKVLFVGGTIPTKLILVPDPGKGEPAELPYARIQSYEYGQQASHRIKTALLLSPWTLFSKKRRHYCSLMWTDAAGKDITFQDDEARKNFGK